MRWAILLVALAAAVGCGKKKDEPSAAPKDDGLTTGTPAVKGEPKAEPAIPPRDYAEYVAELRKTVPVRVDEFKAKGLKCDPYVTSKLADIEIFDSLTLTIDPPVMLKDTLTGKAQKYVGAQMVRSDNGDVFATGFSASALAQQKNGAISITWDSVAMVPDRK